MDVTIKDLKCNTEALLNGSLICKQYQSFPWDHFLKHRFQTFFSEFLYQHFNSLYNYVTPNLTFSYIFPGLSRVHGAFQCFVWFRVVFSLSRGAIFFIFSFFSFISPYLMVLVSNIQDTCNFPLMREF